MSAESQESREYPVEAIHYYPKEKRLSIEVEGGVTFALRQTPDGLLVAQLLLSQVASQRAALVRDDVVMEAAEVPLDSSPPAQQPPEPAVASSSASEAPHAQDQPHSSSKRKENQHMLTGKLLTGPLSGRYPDSQGRPTATALFAAHLEGKEDAWVLSTTFLRAAARTALMLKAGDQITVDGFVNKHKDPNRNDMYSVYMFINYPGKHQKQDPQP
jgi:hypothetical protein